MDPLLLARTIAARTDPTWAVRQGQVVSVGSDYTITVTIAGSSTQVSGVRYLGTTPPLPGTGVWLLASGSDLFALGSLAAAGRSITPRVYRTTDLNITDATDTTVNFEADEFDELSHWVIGTPSRLTCIVPGRYQAVASIRYAGNATGFRTGWILRNGTATLARTQVVTTGAGQPTIFQVATGPFTMAAGDYLQLVTRHNAGATLALNPSSDALVSLAMTYLGP